MRIASIILTLIITFCVSAQAQRPQQQKTNQRTAPQRRSMTPSELAQKAFPSVVEVIAEKADGSPGMLGSGFFVQPGLIATNFHLIKGASKIWARIVGRKRYFSVKLSSVNEETDLTLLKVEGFAVSPLPLGSARNVKVGDEVYAVGNPKGFEGTFSQGIVSAMRGDGYIQITAPISTGSSGGPILNKRGEVIGVATMTVKDGQNLNFAVSVFYLADLIKKGPDYWFTNDLNFIEDDKTVRENPTTIPKGASAKALFDEGKRILYSLNWSESKSADDAAKPYFEAALRKNRDYAEAWLELGNCFNLDFRYLEAAKRYIQAIRANPDYVEAHWKLGEVYSLHADSLRESGSSEATLFYRKAASSFGRAALLKPDAPVTFIMWGEALCRSGQRSKAERAFSKARQLSTDLPEMLMALGMMYDLLDMHQDAVNVITQYLRIKPDGYYGYAQLGVAFKGLGISSADKQSAGFYFQMALEKFKKALRLARSQSDEAYIRSKVGFTYLAMGDKTSALEEYKRIKDLELGKHYAELLFRAIYK